MLRSVPLSLISLSLLLSQGCTPKKKAGHGSNSDTASVSVGPEAIDGVWAKNIVFTSQTSFLNNTAKAKVGRYSLVNLTVKDGQVLVQEKACDIQGVTSSPAVISFPRTFMRSLPDRSYSYQLTGETGHQQLSLKKMVELFGTKLANPLSDPLPSAPDDGRVADSDADGQPGVTVELSLNTFVKLAAQIYEVQRNIWNEDVTLIDAGTMRGSVSWTVEQNIIGSNIPLVAQAKADVEILNAESSVIMRKLPAGSGCDVVLQQKANLFPALVP